MQTWEYSPAYTLRSYAYLLPHALVGRLLGLALWLFGPSPLDKTLIFYGLRIILGLVTAACEAMLVDAVTRRMGPRPGFLFFLLLVTSAGVFQASVALLPSSAAMTMIMAVQAAWIGRRPFLATLLAVTAFLVRESPGLRHDDHDHSLTMCYGAR